MEKVRQKPGVFRVLLGLWLILGGAAWAAGPGPGISPDDALKILQQGNERFLAGKPQYPHQSAERRALTAGQGQHPFAAVLSCSDSRVPVEVIFDQGIGDLFVVRVAGNVAATDEIGSMEYAVDHLGVPLLVVLGHSQCGAVTAAVENPKLPGSLPALLAPIKPAVDKARADNPGAAAEALLAAAVRANVFQALADLLQKSPEVRNLVKAGKVSLLGALYEIDTGQVQWLGPHPEQAQLLGPAAKASPAGKAQKPGKAKAKSQED